MKTRRELFNGISIYQTSIGRSSNATSGGAYKRFTQTINIASLSPFYLYRVDWSVFAAQTYNLELVDSVAATPSILKTLASGVAIGAGVYSFTFDDYLINYSPIYVSLYCATAVRQNRNSVNQGDFGDYCTLGLVGYDGGFGTTGSCPLTIHIKYPYFVGN